MMHNKLNKKNTLIVKNLTSLTYFQMSSKKKKVDFKNVENVAVKSKSLKLFPVHLWNVMFWRLAQITSYSSYPVVIQQLLI